MQIKLQKNDPDVLYDRYEEIVHQLDKVYADAPNTTDKAVALARIALNIAKDNTFTDGEIDGFLHLGLRTDGDAIDNESDVNEVLIELPGSAFPVTQKELAKAYEFANSTHRSTEQFINRLFPVEIRYSLRLECRVTQNGWRDFLLSVERWNSSSK